MQPLVVAHRRNTVAGIEAASDEGADAVEVDVRRTRDGALVLGHDAVQWDRSGRLPRPHLVERSALGSLAFLASPGTGLATALARGLGVKIDAKRGDALPTVAAWCRASSLDLTRTALWCRSPPEVERLRDRQDFAEIALLPGPTDLQRYLDAAVACRASAVSLPAASATAAAVRAAHGLGLRVYAWVTDPQVHGPAAAAGVDGLVTDWVGPARDARG